MAHPVLEIDIGAIAQQVDNRVRITALRGFRQLSEQSTRQRIRANQ